MTNRPNVIARRRYSRDLNQHVIHQFETLGWSTDQIAVSLDMSVRVVQRTLQTWQEIGDVVKDPLSYLRRGKPRLLDTQSVEVRCSFRYASLR